MPDLVRVRRALLSVSDKTGLVEFARVLAGFGVEIISTGGTAAELERAGVRVTPIDAVTGFPEILGGRVKTLHPNVHGGLLGVRDDPEHRAQMERHGIRAIDLLCVNLYPFERTIAGSACTEAEAIEQIDIGGPAMIRSSAKNFEYVAVVTGPEQYARVMAGLRAHDGSTERALRAALAGEAFTRTCRYDAAIAGYLARGSGGEFPAALASAHVKSMDLRYGENPHQRAAVYARAGVPGGAMRGTIASAEQLHGKELSYNNILDSSAALELALALRRVDAARAGAAVIKHTNPCGAALAGTCADAVREAVESDPVAAYGGILAVNRELDRPAAEHLRDRGVFLEVIVAPRVAPEAIEIVRGKSAGVRLLACGEGDASPAPAGPDACEARSIPGGMLVQERDTRLAQRSELQHRAGPTPSETQVRTALFLEAVVKFLFSNAIAIGGTPPTGNAIRLFGAGAGQMDRVTACRLAVEKAGPLARGAVAFSDAFFPFSDGPKLLIEAGVACIVHPGGSKRDQETLDLCQARGVTCLTTGVRHFRH